MNKLRLKMELINLNRFIFAGIVFLVFPFFSSSQNSNVLLSVHLSGIYESKVSLVPLSGPKQFKAIDDVTVVNNGKTAILQVSKEYLPGEFILRFESKENQGNAPKSSEKRVLINKQNLELWVNPAYANIPDSCRFQKDEKENSGLALFSKENSQKVQKLGVLQNFLINYDEPKSKFYKQGIDEYEKRKEEYNRWLVRRTIQDSSFFASSMYRFNYVPQISWEGSEKDREQSVIQHFFDGIDFNDPDIIKTAQMNDFMNAFVNMHMKLITKMSMRDSIISKAATTAIEKSKQGSPIVYGWMVDYFYKGFEANNIPAGMKALEPYLNDPNCLTSKRMEIERRLKGMESLVPGTKAPNILMPDTKGNVFDLDSFNPSTKYILVLFWSADCSHCMETVGSLYPWQQLAENQQKVTVVAVSVDETETELKVWDQKIKELPGWKHIRADEGIRSKVANDYFVLATPVMILLDTKTKEIVSLPASINELESNLK
jgi:thioredoxin-related protein